MGKLFLKIEYKGRIFKHIFNHEGIKANRHISILLTTKGNSENAHFICHLENGHMLIPNTVCIRDETAKIHLNLKGKEFEKYKYNSFIIPIHAIAAYDNAIDNNIDFDYCLELN